MCLLHRCCRNDVAKNILAAIINGEERRITSTSGVVRNFLQRIMKGRPFGSSFPVVEAWNLPPKGEPL
jgi:hypothetical protein